MFVVSLTYKKDLTEVNKYINQHVEFLQEKYAKKIFYASGRKNPRTGGVILAKAENKEQLLSELKDDPFYINEIADYDIIEFIPTMASKDLEFLKELN
jgi:uncharacterized protein YciI